MEADAALRFLQDGQQIQEIGVTPGETVVFRIDNTAGFAHNFYIGTDEELQVFDGTTDVGITQWDTGVQELEWVVPENVSDLRFACTVAGHYYTMQGDFAVSEAAAGSTTEAVQPEPEATIVPDESAEAGTAASEVGTSAELGTATAGEPRIIDLIAPATLQFTDLGGKAVTNIPVTPGEHVRFQVENTAGFPLNFWIGSDLELSVPNATTDVGISDWAAGQKTADWVVPSDVSDLRYAVTVPCFYYTMQGTFSVGGVSSGPIANTVLAQAPAVAEPVAGLAAPSDARVIELEAEGANRFLQDGEQIRDIPLTPGETVVFRIDNTAGFAHNFYIGSDEELSLPSGTTSVGIPDWETGVQELAWVVPEDVSGLRFACTVPGHYYTMQGDFTISA
jgi:uncharacterized cupredoxin-like copper-binding protein